MEPPLLEIAFLGALQGLTEFLPISSDGHLALAEILFGIEGTGLTLNVLLHAGTLLATALVLRQRVGSAVSEGLRACMEPSRFKSTAGGRDAGMVILASIPTAAIGLALRNAVERWTTSPLAVGLGFLLTSAVLISTRFAKPGSKESPSALGALMIGVAQGFAVLPGFSRSGATITMALWLGIKPDRAFELSMLMSLPAVLGAIVLEAPKADAGELGVAAFGAVVAFGVGVAALLMLRRVVVRGWFPLFALWVLPLALATLTMARAWPGSAG
jgi:undecaprenyl-diphosphatase